MDFGVGYEAVMLPRNTCRGIERVKIEIENCWKIETETETETETEIDFDSCSVTCQ
jgi:hypothetical protein